MLSRQSSEEGLTLVELLATILIIGILAAIALPTFFAQGSKANDTDAKARARTLLTSMRICGIEQGGSFTDPKPCNLRRLREIEPSIADSDVSANPRKPAGGFTVRAISGSKTSFTITRDADGSRQRTCRVKDRSSPGSCILTKGKNGVW